MPKLFFRKKKKKEEKPHIQSHLAPKPAFTAVPRTPPPQSTVPRDHTTPHNRPTSAPVPQSEWPQDECSLLEQPDHLSNDEGSDGSDPRYSTVKKEPHVHENHKRPKGDMPPTDHPGMTAPPSVDLKPPVQPSPPHPHSSPSLAKHEPSASPLQEKVLSASVPSCLSVRSDTSDNLSLNPPPPPVNRESQQPRSRHMTEEEKEQLYSTVVKSKMRGKSAELPPKSPHSTARGSESPSMRREKMKHVLAKDLGSKTPPMKFKSLNLEDGSPRQKATSKQPAEKRSRVELLHGSFHPTRRVEHGTEVYAGRTKFGGEEFYANVVEYSDEDYLPSDEASESCTEDRVDSSVTRRHHHSAGHSTNRPPIRSSVKRARSSSWGRHHSAYPAGVPSPPASLSQSTYLQPLSHDNQHVYLFSRRQPDGSLQYYTATALQTASPPIPPGQLAPLESGYLSNLPQQPVLSWSSPPQVHAQRPPSGVLTQIPHPGLIGPAVNQNQFHNVPPLQSNTVQQQQQLVQGWQESSGGKASNMSLQPQPLSIPLSSGEHATTSSSEPKPSLLSAPHPSLSTPERNLELQLEKLSYPRKSSHTHLDHDHQSASPSQSPPTKASTTKRGSPQNTKQHVLDPGSSRSELRDSSKEMDRKQTVDFSGRRLATAGVGSQEHQEALAAVEQRETSLKVRVTALEDANATLQAEKTTLKQLSDKLKDEKDGLWRVYQDEVCQLKEEIAQLSEENQGLLSQIQEGVVERGQWGEVAAHARLVLEENSVLLKQQELQRKQMMEMRRDHEARVSQLSGEVAQLRKERESLGKDLQHLRESHSYLQEHVQLLSSRSSQQLTVEEYQQALQEIESLLEELAERTEADSRTHEAELRVTQKEKNGLVIKLTDAKAIILQLEGECTALHKSNRKAQERISELQYELEASRDREVAKHELLNRVMVQAKKALAERDTFARIAKSQQKVQDRTNKHKARSEHTISKLKKKVETYKDQASHNHDTASLLLHECEQHMRSQRRHYEEEIQRLRSSLVEKQRVMDKLVRDKKEER